MASAGMVSSDALTLGVASVQRRTVGGILLPFWSLSHALDDSMAQPVTTPPQNLNQVAASAAEDKDVPAVRGLRSARPAPWPSDY